MHVVEDLERLRAGFPITRGKRLFLDHCRVAVIPAVAVDAMHHFNSTTSLLGVDYPEKAERYERFKERIALLIGASTDEVAFAHNTAHGINLVANGLSWKVGDNVVTASYEYPDNVYPWLYLARHGVETRFVQPRGERIEVDDVLDAIDERTRLVALSFVQFGNGFRLDVLRIGEACRTRNVRFLLDAVQGLGALRLDVGTLPIDFLAAGGHKWLLGPLGTGFFYCRKPVLSELAVTTIGTASMAQHAIFPYKLDFRTGADRFEGGPAKNTAGIYGLDASLGVLLDVGMERVEQQILDLTLHAIEGLRSRGYRIASPHASPFERSGIVAFNHPERSSDEVVQHFLREDIVISPSPSGARIAPHFYNTRDEIDRFLAALP